MENFKKHSLGQRAFLRFFFRRVKYFLIALAVALALWFLMQWIPAQYAPYADYAMEIAWLLTALCLALVFLYSYLEYHYYTYSFTDEAFIITYGYVVRNEVAAVYHQIQNVNLRRGVLDRFMGVSEVVILMTGVDRESRRNQISLPAVGKTKARVVQQELLQRARKHFVQAG